MGDPYPQIHSNIFQLDMMDDDGLLLKVPLNFELPRIRKCAGAQWSTPGICLSAPPTDSRSLQRCRSDIPGPAIGPKQTGD